MSLQFCKLHRWAALALIAISLGGPTVSVYGDEGLHVNDMVVVLIDAVDVPASASGVVAEIKVREGTAVEERETLARLDDRKVRLQETLARTQLEIARQRAAHGLTKQLAEKKLEQQQQFTRQHEIARDVANRKAENDVRILASKKAEGVAKNELDRAIRAREQFVDSVSRSEIDGLRLAYERSRFETLQASFDREIDVLQAKSENEAAIGHAIEIERSKIEVSLAAAEDQIQRLGVDLQQHQSQLAALARLQHQIVAPISGVVVQRFRNKGDWVNAGDPVIRVIRLDRLRAEGFVRADLIDRLRNDLNVQLSIQRSKEDVIERAGKIVFISPEIDPVNNEVRFWVEFDNSDLEVLPGMRLNMRVDP